MYNASKELPALQLSPSIFPVPQQSTRPRPPPSPGGVEPDLNSDYVGVDSSLSRVLSKI